MGKTSSLPWRSLSLCYGRREEGGNERRIVWNEEKRERKRRGNEGIHIDQLESSHSLKSLPTLWSCLQTKQI